jgi:hypothetical protein
LHQKLCCIFQSHGPDGGGWCADPDESGLLNRFGEFGILGQKAIAGMDCCGSRCFCRLQYPGASEIAFARRCRADHDSFICLTHEGHIGINIRMNGNGANTKRARRARDAAGDLAAIGDEEAFNHCYIRNTPKRARSGIGAFSAAEKARPNTSRVWAGSMMPSSHSLAVA